MRKMMLAATLMFAACGTVEGTGNGDGSNEPGMDAGMGSDSGPPETCMTAEDCGGGRACDVATHECVMGVLTIEPTEEIVSDGSLWWTSTSAPTLRGTFSGPTSAVIQVTAGSGQAVTATLQGATWSAKLTTGSITSAGAAVTVLMTDPSDGHVELVQQIKLDTVAPHISLATSKLRDERDDTLDFSTGEPVHTHAGAEIDLGASGCPSVYKYAYLMDAQNPTFGSQASQNPLAWNFDVVDAKIVAASYRVRNANNQVLLDWTPVMPGLSGQYRVEARRNAIAQLGSYAGQLNIDMRARDWTGLETTFSRCVDFHPLAAPLKIEALQQSATPFASIAALFGMSFNADSPMSELAGFGLGASVVSQRIVQYTSEPIQISLQGSVTNLRVTRTFVDDYVPVSTAAGSCTTGCSWDPPADPQDSTYSGAATSWGFAVQLLDETTNTFVLTYPLLIPARAANEAPHSYRVIAYLGQLSNLRFGASPPSEYTLNGLAYTGYAPSATVNACSAKIFKYFNGELQEYCTQVTTYKRMMALDQASLAMDDVTIDMRTSPSASVTPSAPTNVAASMFASGPLAWDGGDDDLPGAH